MTTARDRGPLLVISGKAWRLLEWGPFVVLLARPQGGGDVYRSRWYQDGAKIRFEAPSRCREGRSREKGETA